MISVQPRRIDLAGLPVRRLLPTSKVRSVGPWVFFDHMGPADLAPGSGIDVIPHPHINLATVTYLFEGELIHRDSIGNVQAIRPGAINLMVAGSGIAHSERTGPVLRKQGHTAHGLQLWLGLPVESEEDPPSFLHYDAAEIPATQVDNVAVRVMMGSAWGLSSPVRCLSPTFYAEARLSEGDLLPLPAGIGELAVYPVAGSVTWEGAGGNSAASEEVAEAQLAVSSSTEGLGHVRAREPSQLALIGGEPIGPRYMWWNFVSSRAERIEQAKADWQRGGFGAVIEESGDRAPLPESDAHSRMKEQSEG